MGRAHITHDRDVKGTQKFSRKHETKYKQQVFITGGDKLIRFLRNGW